MNHEHFNMEKHCFLVGKKSYHVMLSNGQGSVGLNYIDRERYFSWIGQNVQNSIEYLSTSS